MITFIISLAVLVLGYFLYGRLVERVFGPDDCVTPAIVWFAMWYRKTKELMR